MGARTRWAGRGARGRWAHERGASGRWALGAGRIGWRRRDALGRAALGRTGR